MNGAPGPAPAPESERRRLLRLGIVGCGTVILVVLALGTVVGLMVARHPQRFRAALGAIFETLEGEIEKNFSPGVSAADRQEFRDARRRFHDAWNSGRIDIDSADALRRRLMHEAQQDGLTPADVRSLTRFLNALAGAARPPGTVAA